MISSLFCATLLAILAVCYGDPASCGDWEPFKDEHCYKLIDIETTHNYTDAAKLCQQNGGSLISVHTKEEQDFLADFFFTKSKVVDNVWLSAKFDPAEKLYRWMKEDNDSTFTNWAEGFPHNLADYCVQMYSDVKSVGKWVDEPCTKKNLVACQKEQTWSTGYLKELVDEMRKEMAKNKVELVEVKQEFKKSSQKYDQISQELKQTLQKLDQASQKLDQTSQKLDQTFQEVKQNPIPVGFIYVQLPGEKAPSEIWPSLTWTDVSSTYAGVFFRVVGGNATTFGGGVQGDNAPHVTKVEYTGFTSQQKNEPKLLSTNIGETSQAMLSGYHSFNSDAYDTLKFTLSGGEVRPRNLSVKVWKRAS